MTPKPKVCFLLRTPPKSDPSPKSDAARVGRAESEVFSAQHIPDEPSFQKEGKSVNGHPQPLADGICPQSSKKWGHPGYAQTQ